MDLREETRSLEQVRESLETVAYTDKAELQAETQRKLYNRTVNVVMDISALPLGEQKFGKEIQMITAAAGAMNDATEILGRPDTGREATAACAADARHRARTASGARAGPTGAP